MMNEMTKPSLAAVKSEEHWTSKDGGVRLFLFEKCAGDPGKSIGTVKNTVIIRIGIQHKSSTGHFRTIV